MSSPLGEPWEDCEQYNEEPCIGDINEDGFICAMNRHIYEENGIKYAPLEVAKYFSHEAPIPEINGITPFGFHGKGSKWLK